MKEETIEFIISSIMIFVIGCVLIYLYIYVDTSINNLSEENVDIFIERLQDGTLFRNWAIVVFPSVFTIGLLMSIKRKKTLPSSEVGND